MAKWAEITPKGLGELAGKELPADLGAAGAVSVHPPSFHFLVCMAARMVDCVVRGCIVLQPYQ